MKSDVCAIPSSKSCDENTHRKNDAELGIVSRTHFHNKCSHHMILMRGWHTHRSSSHSAKLLVKTSQLVRTINSILGWVGWGWLVSIGHTNCDIFTKNFALCDEEWCVCHPLIKIMWWEHSSWKWCWAGNSFTHRERSIFHLLSNWR